ncbi:hypothetical protein [Halobaculum gomorrense]|uniref:HTTM-like domain-containing protein n=1 Tax=Halobaculum gomorrense TaxID=43928 RepID=A0A1M5TZY2_9EURY|nr:hypothetical protein [Halobaculum gomorrense]SHH55953.1 hypothetical protein SAMN05443636_2849 [Halobaculum gomorrense]
MDWYRLLRSAGTRRLSVDQRALVALRVAVGLLLLTDLLLCTRSLVFFYTDGGSLPRSALFARFPITANLSVHALFGGAWWVGLLFVAAAVAATALALGRWTKIAAACSLVLLVSLHARNPIALNGGDSLLRRTLLWSLFLPLGTGLTFETRAQCRHPAAVGLLVQPIVLYVVNAVIKLRGDVWLSGEAVKYVFRIDALTRFVGEYLAAYPTLLDALGTAWVMLLCCSPLLVLTTGRARATVVAVFASAHVGMALTLGIGLFPLIGVAALIPYLPPTAWDKVEGSWNRSVKTARRVGGERRAAFEDLWEKVCRQIGRLGRGRSLGAAPPMKPMEPLRQRIGTAGSGGRTGSTSSLVSVDRGRIATRIRRIGRAVAATMVVVVLIWNTASLGYVEVPQPEAVEVSPQETRWDMFAPSPPTRDVWYVAVGTLEDGERVEVIRGGEPTWARSERRWSSYPSARWRKYLEVVRWSDDDWLQRHFASGLCARWDATHRSRLSRVTVYVLSRSVQSSTEPNASEGPSVRRTRVRTHECSS